MKNPITRFILRWFVSSLGLWVAAGLLAGRVNYGGDLGVVIIAGLVLAIVNAVLRPLLVILSLPAILLSLGLFMIVVNGFTVFLATKLYPSLQISSFWAAMGTGIIIGLVNYLVSAILEKREA